MISLNKPDSALQEALGVVAVPAPLPGENPGTPMRAGAKSSVLLSEYRTPTQGTLSLCHFRMEINCSTSSLIVTRFVFTLLHQHPLNVFSKPRGPLLGLVGSGAERHSEMASRAFSPGGAVVG